MEPLYISGVVGLIGLMAIFALRLRRRPQQQALIEVRGETAVGAHRMVLVEVEGHKLLVSHTQSGLHLLAAFAAPTASSPAAAPALEAPRLRPMVAQESGPLELAPTVPVSLEATGEPTPTPAPAQVSNRVTLDFGLLENKGESTKQFPFEIQQLAARRG